MENKTYVRPNLQPSGAREAYNSVLERIIKTSDDKLLTGESLITELLHEKSQELSIFA